jgi:hypothetical protein
MNSIIHELYDGDIEAYYRKVRVLLYLSEITGQLSVTRSYR